MLKTRKQQQNNLPLEVQKKKRECWAVDRVCTTVIKWKFPAFEHILGDESFEVLKS